MVVRVGDEESVEREEERAAFEEGAGAKGGEQLKIRLKSSKNSTSSTPKTSFTVHSRLSKTGLSLA